MGKIKEKNESTQDITGSPRHIEIAGSEILRLDAECVREISEEVVNVINDMKDTIKASDVYARVVCHEVDHFKKNMVIKKMRKYLRKLGNI